MCPLVGIAIKFADLNWGGSILPSVYTTPPSSKLCSRSGRKIEFEAGLLEIQPILVEHAFQIEGYVDFSGKSVDSKFQIVIIGDLSRYVQ